MCLMLFGRLFFRFPAFHFQLASVQSISSKDTNDLSVPDFLFIILKIDDDQSMLSGIVLNLNALTVITTVYYLISGARESPFFSIEFETRITPGATYWTVAVSAKALIERMHLKWQNNDKIRCTSTSPEVSAAKLSGLQALEESRRQNKEQIGKASTVPEFRINFLLLFIHRFLISFFFVVVALELNSGIVYNSLRE